jgi:hypothetical protein
MSVQQAVKTAKRPAQRATESLFQPPSLSVEPTNDTPPPAESTAAYSFDTTSVVPGLAPRPTLGIQTKLEVSEPGDPDEEEADRIADLVTRMAEGQQKPRVSRKESTGGGRVAASPGVVDVTRSGGQPLDDATRAFMEPRFGFDFSQVRVHAGGAAADAASSVDARAYTLHEHIVFGEGRYRPQDSAGRHLLAHELAHVVQQREADPTGGRVQRKDEEDPKKERLSRLRNHLHERGALTGTKAIWGPEALYEWAFKHKDQLTEIDGDYTKEYKISVHDDVFATQSVEVAVRAWAYFKHGTMRLADKLFFSLYGTDFDLETMRRVLAKIPSGEFDKAEDVFRAEFGTYFQTIGARVLPNNKFSMIAGVLDSKTLQWKKTAIELRALMAFGEFRPADQLNAELEGSTLSVSWENVLNIIQKAPDKEALKKQYKDSYTKDLTVEVGLFSPDDPADLGLLDNKHKYLAAVILAKGSVSLSERIRVALKFKDDMSVVWSYLESASPDELKKAREERIDNQYLSEMSAEDQERLKALLAENPTAIQKLKGAGADDKEGVLKILKKATGPDRALFADALKKGKETTGDPFVDFLAKKLGGDFADLEIILTKSVEDRLRYAMRGAVSDDEDYVYDLIERHATDADRVAILKQSPSEPSNVHGLMKKCLDGKEFVKVETLLLRVGADAMDPAERARLVRDLGADAVLNSGLASMTQSATALSDENRELGWAIDAVGPKSPGAAETADLNAKSGAVLGATDSLQKTAETVTDVAAQIAGVAVGLVITYFTAGAGVESIALAVEAFRSVAVRTAVAAIAKGSAKVVINAVAKGGNFEVLGAAGADAFVTGVVEGITDVIGPSVARGLVSDAYKAQMIMEGRAAAEKAWAAQPKIRQVTAAMVAGGGGAGLTSMAEAAGQDQTWKQGLGDGVLHVLAKTGQGAATGGAQAAGIEIASPLIARQVGRLSKLIQQFNLGPEAVNELGAAESRWLAARATRRAKVGDLDTTGDDWPTVKQRLRDRKGGAGSDDFEAAFEERAALRDLNILRKKHGLPVGETFSPPPEPRLRADTDGPDTPGSRPKGGDDDPMSMDTLGKKELPPADKERLAEYMAGVNQLALGSKLTEAKLEEIAAHALTKFAPADMPKPKIRVAKVGELGKDTLGGMNRSSWEILIPESHLNGTLDAAASMLAHEARHASQYWLIARYLAAAHPKASAEELFLMMGGVGMHRPVLLEAMKKPANLHGPEGELGHRFFVWEFGTAPPTANWISGEDLQVLIAKCDKAISRAQEMKTTKSADPAVLDEQIAIFMEKRKDAQLAYDQGRPLEVDAYTVDDMVRLGMNPASFKKGESRAVPVPVPKQ